MRNREDIIIDGFSGFERRFIVNLSYVTISLSVFGLFINFFLDFSKILIFFPVFIFLAFYGILIWAKKAKELFFLKVVLTALTLLIVNFFWFWNFGSHGPAPYFFIVIYSLLVFIWHGRGLRLVTALIIINILLVFVIDFLNPDLIKDYENPIARITDVYTGLGMYAILIFFLMNNSKTYLINEYIKAKESDRLKSTFLANLSHEIRTPMNAIIGFSQMLDDPELSVKSRSFYVETINNQGEKLMSLINDIIDISMIESGSIELKEENVNLYDIINEQILLHKSKAKVGVQLNFKEFDDLKNVIILSDAFRLSQIVGNLLVNALKFTNEGSVEIILKHPIENRISITVRDTGIGISKNEYEKIFRSFYQIELKDKNSLHEGTGIGLSMVKAVCEKMGGQITLNSVPNLGSEFKIYLPVKIVGMENPKSGLQKSEANCFSKKALLVEETKINYLYKKELFEQLDCECFKSKTKKSIPAFFNKKSIASEMEFIERIRTLFPALIFIAQHQNNDLEIVKAQLTQIDYFVQKPFQLDEIKEILDSLKK